MTTLAQPSDIDARATRGLALMRSATPLGPDTIATDALLAAMFGREDGDNWRASALCAQVDPDAFFPEKGEPSADAKKACFSCVVREKCLQEALDNGETHGIWGGLSSNQRRKMSRRAA